MTRYIYCWGAPNEKGKIKYFKKIPHPSATLENGGIDQEFSFLDTLIKQK